jgi:site-specific recombinase XerD
VRYLDQGREGLSPKDGEEHIFISQQGKPLSRQSVWHSLRIWGQKAGLAVSLTPRVLRTTAARRMLAQGVPPKTIGLALGHSNPLSTTLLVRRLQTHCNDVPPAAMPPFSPPDA